MQEREAKLLNKSNDLEALVIEQTADKRGWTIRLTERNDSTHYLVSKRGDTPRIFKTSDAALRCCERIGFHQIEVIM